MKKIMFDDRFGLTEAVLNGRKTMTRRFFKGLSINYDRSRFGDLSEGYNMMCSGHVIFRINQNLYRSLYKIGEVVAIAQKYSQIFTEADLSKRKGGLGDMITGKAWDNKMFVQAAVMPHRIRITNIRVECLQDISGDDCLREGIIDGKVEPKLYGFKNGKHYDTAHTPREAFAALIKKMAGKKAWDDNPWVFVYEFELVK